MITKAEIKNAFYWILGREPESDDVYKSFSNLDDLATLRKRLIESKEFSMQLKPLLKGNVRNEPTSSELRETKIVFLHIPKTGGTTLHSLLESRFPADKVCPSRLNTLGEYSATELAKYSFYSGHFSVNSCHLIPGLDKRLITFLREPQSRLKSAFYFWKSHDAERFKNNLLIALSNKFSFVDFLNKSEIFRGRNTYNPYCQLLTSEVPSGDFRVVDGEVELNSYDKKLVELSLHELRKFFYVGFLEEFDNCVDALMFKLGYEKQDKIEKKMVLSELVKNKNNSFKQVQREEENAKFKEALLYNTYLDTVIYKLALEEFVK